MKSAEAVITDSEIKYTSAGKEITLSALKNMSFTQESTLKVKENTSEIKESISEAKEHISEAKEHTSEVKEHTSEAKEHTNAAFLCIL